LITATTQIGLIVLVATQQVGIGQDGGLAEGGAQVVHERGTGHDCRGYPHAVFERQEE
jgi:hypothetical protein